MNFTPLARLMLDWVSEDAYGEPHANYDAVLEYLEERIVEAARKLVEEADREDCDVCGGSGMVTGCACGEFVPGENHDHPIPCPKCGTVTQLAASIQRSRKQKEIT